MSSTLFNYILRLADSTIVLAQRDAEWTGHGPYLEEDLALTNIALDLFGRGKALLEYAAKLEAKGRTEDDLAFFRSERQYFNALITELPKGDYAFTMLRHAIVDTFDLHFYTALTASTDETLKGIASKTCKEIKYHQRHSLAWIKRFGLGTEESASRLQDALEQLWPFTDDLFDQAPTEFELINAGIIPDRLSFKAVWATEILNILNAVHLKPNPNVFMQSGSIKGVHTEHLGHLLAEMQALPRMYPNATW